MNMGSVGKPVVGFVGGGLTACVGSVISVNPATTKIMQIVEKSFVSGAFAGEITLKISGVICILGLSYLIGKNLSKEYLKGFVIGVVLLTILDLVAFVIASMQHV